MSIFKNKDNPMIGVLNEMCTNTLPSKIQSMAQAGQLNRTNYMAVVRHSLNNVLVEITMGCQIELSPEKKAKVKFNKPMPTMMDIQRASQMLAQYMADYENPLMAKFVEAEQLQAQQNGTPGAVDMSVLPEGDQIGKRVLMMDKVDNKHIREMLQQQGILGADILTPSDLLQMASMGAEARRKSNTKKAIIIGTAVIVITGVTVAGVIYYRHKKEDERLMASIGDDDVMIDNPSAGEIDIPPMDNIDIPQVDTKDIPQVRMD